MRFAIAALLYLFCHVAHGETCTIAGPAGYSGPVNSTLTATCGSAPTPPPVITPPPVVTGCAASQLSSPYKLIRQCAGVVHFSYFSAYYSGPTYDLVQILSSGTHNGPWPNVTSGRVAWFQVQTGSYVSWKFTATNRGEMQFTNDPTYGDGGIISLSTVPGAFDAASGALCVYAAGASNSLIFGTPGVPGADCTVQQGKDYYVNFADVQTDGTPLCFNQPGVTSCASSTISYQVLAAGL